MCNTKPLVIDEIPKELHEFYDTDSQYLKQNGEQNNLYIKRICKNCNKIGDVLVNSVRTAIRKGQLTGTCRGCAKGIEKPLTVDEIPEELRHAYNLNSQYLERKDDKENQIRIERTCVKCGRVDRVSAYNTRTAIKNKHLTGMCFRCATSRRGEGKGNWKGGRRKDGNGYIKISDPDYTSKYVHEHRLIMEKQLGRHLLPTETVHHKNGIRDDNRVENLELRTGKHGTGWCYDDMDNAQINDLIIQLQEILELRKFITIQMEI